MHVTKLKRINLIINNAFHLKKKKKTRSNIQEELSLKYTRIQHCQHRFSQKSIQNITCTGTIKIENYYLNVLTDRYVFC